MRLAAGGLACLLLLGLSVPVGGTGTKGKTERISMTTGSWSIDPDGHKDKGQVQLELRREWRTEKGGTGRAIHSFGIAREQLSGLSPDDWTARDADVRFTLDRDAGRVRFEGTMRRGRGSGTYSFEPSAAFRSELKRGGFREVTDDDLLRLVLHDIGREWIGGFDGRGDRLTLDDIVRFKVHGVTPEYFASLTVGGYRALTPDDIVRFKVHGVDAEYVSALADLGVSRPSPDELVRLKLHGVDTEYVREMLLLASPKPDVDDMVRMHIHGVEPEFVRGLRSAGYGPLGSEELVRLKVNGVSTSDARRARTRYGNLSVEELIRLKHRGQI